MRFFFLKAAFALANIVSASTLSRLPALRDLALPQSDVAQLEEFPVTARSESATLRRRRSLGPTNGELMKRGLQPASRPRKLYQPRTLAIRQANEVPANAQASGAPPSSQTYEFVACYGNAAGTDYTNFYLFTFTDVQDLANKCAAQQDKETASNPSGASQNFVMWTVRQEDIKFNCATAISLGGYAPVTCSPSTFGIYSPA